MMDAEFGKTVVTTTQAATQAAAGATKAAIAKTTAHVAGHSVAVTINLASGIIIGIAACYLAHRFMSDKEETA